MPKFLFKASYSADGARGVADKGGTARRDAIEQLFSSLGGSMEAFYFAFGDADVYVFGDLPDQESAAAVALTVNSDGRASVSTVVLLTAEQLDSAAQRTPDYRAPGA
jgi:uncharacterized protein with GYD domain